MASAKTAAALQRMRLDPDIVAERRVAATPAAASVPTQRVPLNVVRQAHAANAATRRLVELGEPKMLGAGAFQALAGYIFGKNKREEKMAMTTPVFTRAGQMEFVLPKEYWKDLGKAPPPLTNVELTYGEGGLVAAAYYGGYATKDEVARRSAELVEAIEASDYAVAGETYSAAYNDPFTPPWRRRNEVLVPVEKRG